MPLTSGGNGTLLNRVSLRGFLVINIFALLSLLVLKTFVLEAGAMEEDSPAPLSPYLFFAAENTDDIQSFKIDDNGDLISTGEKISIPSPVCLLEIIK